MRGRRQYLIALTAACAIVLLSSAAQSGPADARRVSVSNVASDVVSLTNAERARQGRKRLRSSPQLMQAAQIHAEQMARAGRLAHDLPKARYPETKDRLAAVKYRWTAFGENVAQGQPNAAEVLKDWMRSSGHRKNILNSYYTELGTGYATDRAGRTYFVQVFATPAS
ncbi:MAG TPA: CAP domain-containing protein [Vicinamibacterales bacterium]|nr:CAP domain-containing protein [Vicinamibacterales bacterium]